jgi:hypothetical protein
MSFRCSVCGEHADLPHVGMEKPEHWFDVPEHERASRVQLTSDTCVIDNDDFFVRGVIQIHVHDYPENFGIGVWVSQKRENFYKYLENYKSDEIGPFFGWLCSRIGFYKEDTLLLKTMVYFHGDNLRPSIVLEETEHPMALDQKNGISLGRAWEIIHFYSDQSV